MADLIDRQTAIETAIEAADKWDGGYSSEREGIIRKFFDKVPAAQPDHVADISKKVEEDCISRQMALKELAAYIHLIDKTMGKGTLTDDDCMEAAKSVLGEDELPAVQPEQLWIPSSEKPPKEGSYLVWMPFAPPENRIAVAKCCDGYWNIKTPISAWMPLPEPYRGGGE